MSEKLKQLQRAEREYNNSLLHKWFNLLRLERRSVRESLSDRGREKGGREREMKKDIKSVREALSDCV